MGAGRFPQAVDNFTCVIKNTLNISQILRRVVLYLSVQSDKITSNKDKERRCHYGY